MLCKHVEVDSKKNVLWLLFNFFFGNHSISINRAYYKHMHTHVQKLRCEVKLKRLYIYMKELESYLDTYFVF